MVMKLHQVQYWFFTSKVNGQILKKRRANSNAREILEAWGKKIRKHPCDLFAYTMHSEEMDGVGDWEQAVVVVVVSSSK